MEEKSISQMRAELREFYFNKIKPELQNLNIARKYSTVQKFSVISILSGFLLLSLFGGFTINGKTPIIIKLGLFLTILGFVSFFAVAKLATDKSGKINIMSEDDFKVKYMPEFLQIFSDKLFWGPQALRILTGRNFGIMPDSRNFKLLNIMPPHLFLSYDDIICGNYKGVNFNILECDTSLSSVKNIMAYIAAGIFAISFGFSVYAIIFVILSFIWPPFMFIGILGLPIFLFWKCTRRAPFRGVVVEFEMNKNFEGHTFILERAKTSRTIKFNRSKFEEVKLEDTEFGKMYKIYSDNQVEARYVLTTAFIERIKNIKTAFKAKYMRVAFKDGKITLALHAGRDLFAMSHYNKETDSHTFMGLFDELLSVFELVEELKLNQRPGL